MQNSIDLVDLELDLGDRRREAMRHVRANPDQCLRDFLAVYPARTRHALDENTLALPLKQIQIVPVHLQQQGEDAAPSQAAPQSEARSVGGELHHHLDELYAADVAATAEPVEYPDILRDDDAVRIAYRHELQAVAKFLRNDLSVLIVCDKALTEHIYEYVCVRAGREPVLEDAAPVAEPRNEREAFDRAMRGPGGSLEENLHAVLQNLDEGQVLVLRSLDILDSPPLIELLYQSTSGGRKPQILGFLDPSLEARKVLTDRFAIRVAIQGLPRYIHLERDQPRSYTVPHLITAHERIRFAEFDAEGIYKNVAGLNALQFRNAMRYVGAVVAENSSSRAVYDVIRYFKTSASDEIEIPDTGFDDIGGYDAVKHELQRIVALSTGRVKGLDERERQRLIPRGFIFHGPPGTGKTLFAKAIANEMNATIQMISGPEIMDKYVGQSESNLRQIFSTARRNAPSVIFFDEFDSLASQRSTYTDGGARANNAVVAQLLTELDGFREEQSVLVIGTTNRIDIIDEALLRPSRLQPIEIGLPDYVARRSVARIHAANFGIDALLIDLCLLMMDHLPTWQAFEETPRPFLDALFDRHPPYRQRYEVESQKTGFLRDLRQFFELVDGLEAGDEKSDNGEADAHLLQLEKHLLKIGRNHGLDLSTTPEMESEQLVHQTIEQDLRDLFNLVNAQHRQDTGFSALHFYENVLGLVAEYTEGFNNDEIRSIFQDASLEHHLEGQLITPRYLGLKIGLLRRRRDERQVVHLDTRRG